MAKTPSLQTFGKNPRSAGRGRGTGKPGDDQIDAESRGGSGAARPRGSRRRTIAPVKGRGRKLTISDGVYERLQLAAITNESQG